MNTALTTANLLTFEIDTIQKVRAALRKARDFEPNEVSIERIEQLDAELASIQTALGVQRKTAPYSITRTAADDEAEIEILKWLRNRLRTFARLFETRCVTALVVTDEIARMFEQQENLRFEAATARAAES